MPQLPPWLTRQYDYAAGFQGIGDAVIKGRQAAALMEEHRARTAVLAKQFEERSQDMLMRQIGMQNVQLERARLIASGVDPVVASKTAILNNPEIFGSSQAGYSQFVANERDNQTREKADLMIQKRHADDLIETRHYHDNLAKTAGEKALAKAKEIKLKEDEAEARRIALGQTDAKEVKTPEGEVIGYNVPGVNGPHFTPKKADSEKLPEAKKLKVDSLYKEIGILTQQKAKIDLAESTRGPDEPGLRADRMRLQFRIGKLQKEVDNILGTTGKPAPASAAEPAPAKAPELKLGQTVIQNGVKFRYQGGDPKDPSSYVEVK